MTDVKPWQSFAREATVNGHVNWSSAFHFEIPRAVDAAIFPYVSFPAVPPSLAIRTANFGALNYENYEEGGCQIVYTLRARSMSDGICVVESFREIDMFPNARPLPPLDIKDFPGEYRLTGFKQLRNGFISRKIGDLYVATGEPQPLQFDRDKDTLSTEIALDVRFYPSSLRPLAEPPKFCYCEVASTLKAFTSISATEQMSGPTMRQKTPSPGFIKIVRCSSRQTRKLRVPIWREMQQHNLPPGNQEPC